MNRLVLSITANILLFLSVTAQGQTQKKYNWGIYVGGGLSAIQYNPEEATYKTGLGGKLGISWSYFFKPQWALNTGLEWGVYQSKAQSDFISGSESGVDPLYPDNNYRMDYSYQSFEEKQKLYMLNIPIMLEYWFSPKFYAAAGGKLGIPVSGQYEIFTGNITTTGFFSHEGRTYSGADYGFKSSDNKYIRQDLDLDIAYILSAEFGIKWKVFTKTNLLTSIYFDYGLNNMQNSTAGTLVSYQPESSDYLKFNSITATGNKVNIVATGVKICMSF